jgi:hypothetical protein
MEIKSKVIFGDSNLRKAFDQLDNKLFQEDELKKQMQKTFAKLEQNAFSGIQIKKSLIPKEYYAKFGPLDNLWKYNLPNAGD